MTNSDDVARHAGAGEMTTFEVVNPPSPEVVFEPFGETPEIVWRYDHDECGNPAPEDFDLVSHLEVKLTVAMTDWDDDVLEAAEDVHEAIVELREAMMDARGLDDKQRHHGQLGCLDALLEVEKRSGVGD